MDGVHEGRIRGLVYAVETDVGAPLLLSGGEDRHLQMTAAGDGARVRTIERFNGRPGHTGHSDKIYVITTWESPDGPMVVSSGDDKLIRIFSLAPLPRGPGIRTMSGHIDYVHTLHVLQEKHQALSASYDRSIRLWDLVEGEQLKIFKQDFGLFCMAWNDEASAFATGCSNNINIWNLNDEGENKQKEEPKGIISSLFGGGKKEEKKEEEKKEDKEEKEADAQSADKNKAVKQILRLHKRTVTSILYPRIDLLITGSDDSTLILWNPLIEEAPMLERLDTVTPIYSMRIHECQQAFLLVTASYGKPYSVLVWNLDKYEIEDDDAETDDDRYVMSTGVQYFTISLVFFVYVLYISSSGLRFLINYQLT